MPYDISYYYEQIGCLYKGKYASDNSFILIKDVVDKKDNNGYHFLYEVYNYPTGSGGYFESIEECNYFLDIFQKIS